MLPRRLGIDHIEAGALMRLLKVEGLLGLTLVLALQRRQLNMAAHRAIVVVLHLHSLMAQHALLLLLMLLEGLERVQGD